ncbi:alpha/beta fold hydrolase [Actinokineospora bangkokensis]|uniref:AB hydrolase-1 domain-containing protein n=1 Tax=Actinokineospora bangkokensis TaxID=1193682 RepID=A0A1Q9LGT9_9PSEU|nr:alpha/beta hydrolase [Actinokineospora bangkokensis]OLR91159.1 hypothetical protein BJP25_29365 [Actinokineospora bangkokensis]
MEKTSSADGTEIAFEVLGSGPPVVLVGGAFQTRLSHLALAHQLAGEFTAVVYDRRGRGDSGDSPRYAVDREVEDLLAVISAAGGGARVFGMSSGAVLALRAAAAAVPVVRLAAYEPPFLPSSPTFADEQSARIAAGDRAAAVRAFLRVTGVPDEGIDQTAQTPAWSYLVDLAHTLPYDARIVGDGTLPDLSATTVPTLIAHGTASPTTMVDAARATAEAVPGSRLLPLPDQTHHVDEAVLGPALLDFFRG